MVIEGFVHNDDPTAERMWLTPGAFWTQPAGESHVTAANGVNNLIYIEIDSGPYLVLAKEKAFDNGERPINVRFQKVSEATITDMFRLPRDVGIIAQHQIAEPGGAPRRIRYASPPHPGLPDGHVGVAELADALA